jgi:hypothetical protein
MRLNLFRKKEVEVKPSVDKVADKPKHVYFSQLSPEEQERVTIEIISLWLAFMANPDIMLRFNG